VWARSSVTGTGTGGREAAPEASKDYAIWLQPVRQEITVAEGRRAQKVDRSTIMRIKKAAKDGALAALPAFARLSEGAKPLR